MTKIEFGTDGWRGVIADDYTMASVSRVAQATGRYLKSDYRSSLDIYEEWHTPFRPHSDGVIIGYDTRFMSEKFALLSARVLINQGVPAAVGEDPVPTPALSWAVKDHEAAAGIMITASHNPPEYNGFKFKCEFAASAPPLVTDKIEAELPDEPPEVDKSIEVPRIDIKTDYIEAIAKLIDPEKLKNSPLLAVVDSMYGSASGLVGEILKRYDVPSVQIRGGGNPGFNGIRPEPLEEYLDPLKEAIRAQQGEERLVVGVVTDGDGDRISAMDENAKFIDAHRTYALLMKYLVETKGWTGKAVKNFPLTDMIFKIGERNDIPVEETPVGFKYIAEKMIREDVVIGGEESGGIGVKNHIPERDGILCALFLLEMVGERGKQISGVVEELMEQVGHHYYHRNDIHLEERREVVEKVKSDPPSTLGGFEIRSVETLDGAKLRLDDGWVLVRASGTEPLLRIYCEMNDRSKVDEILAETEKYARKLAGG